MKELLGDVRSFILGFVHASVWESTADIVQRGCGSGQVKRKENPHPTAEPVPLLPPLPFRPLPTGLLLVHPEIKSR
jgi:hypothetical protein